MLDARRRFRSSGGVYSRALEPYRRTGTIPIEDLAPVAKQLDGATFKEMSRSAFRRVLIKGLPEEAVSPRTVRSTLLWRHMATADRGNLRCLPCQKEVPMRLADYGLHANGSVYELLICPVGHRNPRAVALDPPPPAEDLDLTRVYVMGAAAGFAAGVQREGKRVSRVMRSLHLVGVNPAAMRMMLGRSGESIRQMVTGQYPRERQGTYAPAAAYISELGLGRRASGRRGREASSDSGSPD